MIYLPWGIASGLLVFAVYWIWKCRNLRQSLRLAQQNFQKSQQQVDELYRENLLLKNQGKDYTVVSDYEAKLLGTPPILDFLRKTYCPVVRVSGYADNWQINLVGAEIYVADRIGDDFGALVIERCVNRISAEEYDDFWIQLREGFTD